VKAVVVGHGSIGQRHARILTEMGCRVSVVSRQAKTARVYARLEDALAEQPDYVVVANRTHEHRVTLEALIASDFRGRVLMEKPLFAEAGALREHGFAVAAVAYNLRCHPLLIECKRRVDEAAKVVNVHVYVGSYLPDWRPGTRYSDSYSACRDQGGGVLRDLSHELDLTLWLVGAWRRLAAIGGRFSDLAIDSDDTYTLLMETVRCRSVTTHVSYLDRPPRRRITINTNRESIEVDLTDGTITIDGLQDRVTVGRDDTYRAEHEAMLGRNGNGLCTFEEALETMTTIAAAERASTSSEWVSR